MHLFRVVTSANKLSAGNHSEEEKERKKKKSIACLRSYLVKIEESPRE